MDLAFFTKAAADPHTLAYAFGTLGILAEWRSYQSLCILAFRRWSATGALLWAIQYGLLGAWTAGLTMALTALRTLCAGYLSTSGQKHRTALLFIAIFAILTAISWQGCISLLPGFAVINATIALFYLKNMPMRRLFLLSSILWIANDFYWQAWPALLAETVAVGINLRSIRRLAAQDANL